MYRLLPALYHDILEQLSLKRDTFRFEPTRFLWDIGLAYHCDRFGAHDYPVYYRYPSPDQADYREIEEGDLVWVRFEDLSRFISEYLERGTTRFFLFTGGGDWSVPSRDTASAEKLAASGRILHWFTHNYDLSDRGTSYEGLLTGVPIGIDFHTRARKHYLSWAEWRSGFLTAYRQQSPHAQETGLRAQIRSAPPRSARIPNVFADFHLNNSSYRRIFGESRADIQQRLSANPALAFAEKRVHRTRVWQQFAAHRFVISPHGGGLDCVRTWEALALGCIVIVKTSALDALYANLPVVIVQDWDEITPENLTRWYQRFEAVSPEETRQRISFDHWFYGVIRRKMSAIQQLHQARSRGAFEKRAT